MVCPSNNNSVTLKILRKFPFSSALKRMSTISSAYLPSEFVGGNNSFDSNRSGKYLVSVKGAPEVLKSMFTTVPDDYDKTFKYFAMNGYRVIALGTKWIKLTPADREVGIGSLERDAIESQLSFCGFLVFNCPLKKDTADAIQELHESSHRIVMITGDSALTACHVAKELGIVRKDVIILDVDANGMNMFLYL